MQDKLSIGCERGLDLGRSSVLLGLAGAPSFYPSRRKSFNGARLKLVRFPRFSKSKKEEVRIMTCAQRGSSVVVTDRRRRQCRGLSPGAGLRSHRASAGSTEIFPAARARGLTIP